MTFDDRETKEWDAVSEIFWSQVTYFWANEMVRLPFQIKTVLENEKILLTVSFQLNTFVYFIPTEMFWLKKK